MVVKLWLLFLDQFSLQSAKIVSMISLGSTYISIIGKKLRNAKSIMGTFWSIIDTSLFLGFFHPNIGKNFDSFCFISVENAVIARSILRENFHDSSKIQKLKTFLSHT